MPIALITGASRGLGLALARSLAQDGWSLVIDARGAEALEAARAEVAAAGAPIVAVAGDVADPGHRETLVATARRLGSLDLLVNNASILGPSPQPRLEAYPLDVLEAVYRVNVLAPLALFQAARPLLEAARGRVINVTSDASIEPYPGWGGYGSSKAALDQVSRVLAAEHPELRIYAADPGDMRTQMHQAAFPGEDISDRPPPEAAVPGLRRLIDGDLPSGRYRVADLLAELEEAAR
jgi:NAD(P)-dependent dehydrogenase (short-subunit alcohol dehydrogenase family)